MVVAALLLSFLTWWELDIRPRTDDAYLRANIVGIAANVSGYITELNVVDNQKVNVGDLLFRVDVRPYQAELDLAIANLGLVDLEIIALKDAIVQRDADIVSAEAKALYDVQFLARMEPLLPRQFVTPDQIDAAKEMCAHRMRWCNKPRPRPRKRGQILVSWATSMCAVKKRRRMFWKSN